MSDGSTLGFARYEEIDGAEEGETGWFGTVSLLSLHRRCMIDYAVLT